MNHLVFLAATGQQGGDILQLIIVWGAMFAALWFFMIRPQRKRQKETMMMQNSLQVGDSVMTNSGMYGKIADVVNDIAVVEFGKNKSVLIPVHKSAITSVAEPDLSLHKEDEADAKKDKE